VLVPGQKLEIEAAANCATAKPMREVQNLLLLPVACCLQLLLLLPRAKALTELAAQ
jgi:hypothetical protein